VVAALGLSIVAVLMDIRMPVMNSLAPTELVRARDDAPEVIVLTTFEADDYVVRALRAGEPTLSPAITRRLIGHVTDGKVDERRRSVRERLDQLTDREREVAHMEERMSRGRG
jgi:DNA-binding NarL/FixJ family response regulator